MHGEDRQVLQQALEVLAAGGVPDAQSALAQGQAVPGAHGRLCQAPPDTANGLEKGTNDSSRTCAPLSAPAQSIQGAQTWQCENEHTGQATLPTNVVKLQPMSNTLHKEASGYKFTLVQ